VADHPKHHLIHPSKMCTSIHALFKVSWVDIRIIGRSRWTRFLETLPRVGSMNTASDFLRNEPWPRETQEAAGATDTEMTVMTDRGLESVYMSEGKYGPYQVVVRSASSTLIVDEPFGAGGMGSGPTPFDLLSAALGSCALMTMRRYASDREWPLERLVVRISHDRPALASKDRFLKEIQVIGSLTAAQIDALMDVATRCPVHVTVARGSDIETRLMQNGDMIDMAVGRTAHMRAMKEACQS
jgi:putative redox protein